MRKSPIPAAQVVTLLLAGSAASGEAFESVDPTLHPARALIARYAEDRQNLHRFYDAPLSKRRREREERFLDGWEEALFGLDFDGLDVDGQVDYVLFRNELRSRRAALGHEREKQEQTADLLPFADAIVDLHEARRALTPVDAERAAASMAELAERIEAARERVEGALPGEGEGEDGAETPGWKPAVANRAAEQADRLRRTLERWYAFYHGYDPLFTWWVTEPYEQARETLEDYAKLLRTRLAGVDDEDAILGDPIGRAELLSRLRGEMIPYTPAQLVAIAERELAWCRERMLEAARELGFGDDWKAALDHVKSRHVQPGEQPRLIRDLAREAVDFIEQRDLVTVPALCRETWRMEMMSPERQKTSPYFLGGEVIMVAFPTQDMEHGDKLMSMRGNNRHFARATVHHELIPGHHLQGFMTRRYRAHRGVFSTPFWVEGWALYWEMLLWDLGFAGSPEDRIGMLFWRSHRCARIIFSLRFHLEQLDAQECIEFLVDNVGHERNNAAAEVRRSVSGAYGPLYQAAYMLGGLQIRALHREVVGSGRMTDRAFHDAVLQQNSIPIEMVRAAIAGRPLDRDHEPSWHFYGQVAVGAEED